MKLTDVQDIAIELSEAHPDVDPSYLRFTDRHSWIQALEGFDDHPEKSNERLLEAIQAAWMEEKA